MTKAFDLNERRRHEREMINTTCTRPWELAVAPVQVAPHVFYAGNSWVGVYWIDTGDGLILLDAGMPFQLYTIFEGMRCMGYDPRQIKLALLSHAHYDHCGAMKAVLEYTGAVCYAPEEDMAQLLHPDARLMNFGNDYQIFEPDMAYMPGKSITLGNISVEPVHAGGHTPGTTCFFFNDRESSGRSHTVGIHGGLGLSMLGDDCFDSAAAAWAARADYRSAQRELAMRRVDIPLSFHPYNLNILERAAGGWQELVDAEGWQRMLEERLAALDDIERTSIYREKELLSV